MRYSQLKSCNETEFDGSSRASDRVLKLLSFAEARPGTDINDSNRPSVKVFNEKRPHSLLIMPV